MMEIATNSENGNGLGISEARVRSKARVLEQIGPDTQRVLLPDGMEVHRGTPLTTKNEILKNVREWSGTIAPSSNGSLPKLQFQESA